MLLVPLHLWWLSWKKMIIRQKFSCSHRELYLLLFSKWELLDNQSSGRTLWQPRYRIIWSGGTDCPTSRLRTHRVTSFSGEFISLRTVRKIQGKLNFQSQSQKQTIKIPDQQSFPNPEEPYSAFHVTEVSTSFANKGFKPLAHTSFWWKLL